MECVKNQNCLSPSGTKRDFWKKWCRWRDSNSRPSVYKTAALPLCYTGKMKPRDSTTVVTIQASNGTALTKSSAPLKRGPKIFLIIMVHVGKQIAIAPQNQSFQRIKIQKTCVSPNAYDMHKAHTQSVWRQRK